MAMLSNWLTKSAEVITNSAKSIASGANNNNIDTSSIVREILTKIEVKLSKQLGENLEGGLESISADIIREIQLEKNLIEIKQKYHQLVSLSETQNESVKQMMQSFMDFFKNISKSLNNEDMIAPLKQLQSGFYLCNVTKVDKQLKYFWKLYEVALGDFTKGKLNSKADEHKDEIALLKTLNKNMEVQLFRSRNNCSDLQKRLAEINCKNQQVIERMNILQKLGAENAILNSSKEKQKAIQRQNQLLDRIKVLEKEKQRVERSYRQAQSQVLKSTSAIEIIRSNNDSIIQQMKRQISKKQANYQHSISKICNQKIHLEGKIRGLNADVQLLKQQIRSLKEEEKSSPKINHQKTHEIKQLAQRVKELEEQNQNSKKKIQSLVSKQMMKNLFLSFEDQSKQWTVRRDIKNQIYLLLDIKPKKVEEKKWFSLF